MFHVVAPRSFPFMKQGKLFKVSILFIKFIKKIKNSFDFLEKFIAVIMLTAN